MVLRQTIYSIWILTIHVQLFHCSHPCRLLNVSVSVGSGLGITSERVSVLPPRHHHSPTLPASSCTGSSTFLYPTASPSLLSNSCQQAAPPLEATMFVGTQQARMEARRYCRAKPVMPVAESFKNHKTIFSIVDWPPSWSGADDSLQSMLDPEEDEDDMPNDKGSTL